MTKEFKAFEDMNISDPITLPDGRRVFHIDVPDDVPIEQLQRALDSIKEFIQEVKNEKN